MTEPRSTHSASDVPNVLIWPPLLYGVALGVGFLLQWIAPRPIASSNAGHWVGGALLVSGVLLAIWGRRVMEQAGTSVNPTLPTTALVAIGPFRFSRNPLYVALTLMYVGLALLANALWVLVLIAPALLIMHYGVIRREERYLEGKFPEAYREYRSRVRRYV
jgi:protein-S-isoprenylcysteine O-methyltransferase Ste14